MIEAVSTTMTNSSSIQSPFFSRAYGGYTNAQLQCVRDILGTPKGKTILDPMAGQAFALSQMSWEGANVRLGDINPATLLLASLRDPTLIRSRQYLRQWLSKIIATLAKKRVPRVNAQVVSGWIAPSTAHQLDEYARRLGLGLFANPFTPKSDFWTGDIEARFGAAIAVMAARDIACYRTTDNVTWLRPGGILRARRISDVLRSALDKWVSFANSVAAEYSLDDGSTGSIVAEPMNVERGLFGRTKNVSWIITSPPYANRLDYTRMWGPEINVLASMVGANAESLKREQVGTTVVEGIDYSEGEKQLPRFIRVALQEIQSDQTKYSENYYYPFFRNYAVSLMHSMKHLAERLRVNGTLMVFVRDTVRKDVLFPTGRLITSALTGKSVGLVRLDAEKQIIRQHIGFVRKASSKGVYGLAQQEWWLVFKKPSRSGQNGSS